MKISRPDYDVDFDAMSFDSDKFDGLLEAIAYEIFHSTKASALSDLMAAFEKVPLVKFKQMLLKNVLERDFIRNVKPLRFATYPLTDKELALSVNNLVIHIQSGRTYWDVLSHIEWWEIWVYAKLVFREEDRKKAVPLWNKREQFMMVGGSVQLFPGKRAWLPPGHSRRTAWLHPRQAMEQKGFTKFWIEYSPGHRTVYCMVDFDNCRFNKIPWLPFGSFIEFLYAFMRDSQQFEEMEPSLSSLPFEKVRRYLRAELLRLNGEDISRIFELPNAELRQFYTPDVRVRVFFINAMTDAIVNASNIEDLLSRMRAVKVIVDHLFLGREVFKSASEGPGKGWHGDPEGHSRARRHVV